MLKPVTNQIKRNIAKNKQSKKQLIFLGQKNSKPMALMTLNAKD